MRRTFACLGFAALLLAACATGPSPEMALAQGPGACEAPDRHLVRGGAPDPDCRMRTTQSDRAAAASHNRALRVQGEAMGRTRTS